MFWHWSPHPPPPSWPVLSAKSDSRLSSLILRFLNERVISKVKPQKCYLSRIFSVPKFNGQLRLIPNLSLLSKFIRTPLFKMHNHETLGSVLPQGSWMTKFDIQDVYLHVPVTRKLRRFLVFCYQNVSFSSTSYPSDLPWPIRFHKADCTPFKASETGKLLGHRLHRRLGHVVKLRSQLSYMCPIRCPTSSTLWIHPEPREISFGLHSGFGLSRRKMDNPRTYNGPSSRVCF